eukprot:SM000421S16085  [mRNA]  locus=s421:15139:16658:+ [translate_table: standard]
MLPSTNTFFTTSREASNERLTNSSRGVSGSSKSYSVELDQVLLTLGALQDSANQVTPQAALALEMVQTSVQNLTPTAQSALVECHKRGSGTEHYSLDAKLSAHWFGMPAFASVATIADAGTLASTAQTLTTIAVNSTKLIAMKEASLVFRAADRNFKRAGGVLKAFKDDQHGACIPATEDAYLMCCNDFTKDMQERHLTRTPRHAVEKVKSMRKSGVLLKVMEIVYHSNSMSFTCDKDTIEMPEGMGRFIMCGSTDLHGQPYIKLKREF